MDLGGMTRIYQVDMALPPSWGTRTQTISIEGSTDGETYKPIVGRRPYLFDPSAGNRASTGFNVVKVRYVRLTFTGNTGWPAAQLAELGVIAT